MKHIYTLLVGLILTAAAVGQQVFESGILILKINEEFRSACTDSSIQELSIMQVLEDKHAKINKYFPNKKPPVARGQIGLIQVDLSLIYRVTLNEEVNEKKLVAALNSLDAVEYATLNYYSEIAAVPNDPMYSNQYHHALIGSANGWAIQTGKKAVRIAILDTGTDLDHPDLITNHYENVNDPQNGLDDDGNGFVDDTYGWDFVDNDGIPQATLNDHGVHVGGLAAAATNNAIGVAGMGFNSTHVPIRVGEDRAVTYGYDGIVYAADEGFDIINCSWGSFNYSPFAQDVVAYASINKGALVVAAAGNNGVEQSYYPAAYPYVLAVGATQQDQQKANFSNYGFWVDVMAPGQNIWSTTNNGEYGFNSGTSMATPIVAGLAALVKANYPALTGVQIAERIKSTTTNISQIGVNTSYTNKIGSGMINPQAALFGNILEPSVVYENIAITDYNDEAFVLGDTIRIGGIFTNYLNATNSLTATMSTPSTSITFLKDTIAVGVLQAMSSYVNYNEPFSFIINPSAINNDTISLTLTISDGTYETKQFLEITVNVDYLNILVNNVETTLAGNSSIGYIERQGSSGLGFALKGEESQLFEANIMIGCQANGVVHVLDNVRDGQQVDSDFQSIESIIRQNAIDTAFYASGVFSDEGSQSDTLGVKVLYESIAYDLEGHKNYVLFKYQVVNVSGANLDSVYIGLFTDWDVNPYAQNKAVFDAKRNVAYVYSNSGVGYFGALSLSQSEPNVYCFDNVSGGSGGIDIFNSFTTTQKYQALQGGRYASGQTTAAGNDVVQTLSAGPYNLANGDTQTVSFALVGAHSLEEFYASADSAISKYLGLNFLGVKEQKQQEVKVFPNPTSQLISWSSTEQNNEVSLFTSAGQKLVVKHNVNQLDLSHLPNGLYLLEVKTDNQILKQRIIKQ